MDKEKLLQAIKNRRGDLDTVDKIEDFVISSIVDKLLKDDPYIAMTVLNILLED